MKTSQHKLLSLIFCLMSREALAFNQFSCLRDLLPITIHGAHQTGRTGVEQPFMVDDKYMVFPEVEKKTLTGFYVYSERGAWYFDSIQDSSGGLKPLVSLKSNDNSLYRMVAQPEGLETVAIHYRPGFCGANENKDGPVVLGASILPVIGAFVSRPKRKPAVYQNPVSGRAPAAADERIVKLGVSRELSRQALWRPLTAEISLRENWITERNLDDETFRALRKVQRTSCQRR